MGDLRYLSGFANEHITEAITGAVPVGQFSPQRTPFGLYPEKFSATAFTAPRRENRRTWFYRIRPSVLQGDFAVTSFPRWRTPPLVPERPVPNQLRWDPWPIDTEGDFLDGMTTLVACGHAAMQAGMSAHVYTATRPMTDRYFYDADGELLILPQQGRLAVFTECGQIEVAPREMLLVPRGMKFRVDLPDGPSRGYVCENFGAAMRLPERGPVGSDGFANDRDFLAPVAWFEDRERPCELVAKFGGAFFRAALGHSPLDVVGWVGTAYPVKFPLEAFNVMNTVSYDHPDPSIFTVLTAPSDTPGVANVDFVIFPPRWMVAEHTFRPPWFHRNVMSEFMGLIYGQYDAKERGFEPGGASLHSSFSAHGPEQAVYAKASEVPLMPTRMEATLAFMFESRYLMTPTAEALGHPALQADYLACWQGLERRFPRT
ncbi:MAG: homogentisate 1,2-dioxygenase [Gammaproteobacteria bacterium]